MINLKKARKLIGDKEISDEELSEIINNLYRLAELSIENYIKEKLK